MTQAPSRPITSDQSAPDQRLAERVARHLRSPYQRPIAAHTQAAVDWLLAQLDSSCPLVLDAGCGTGQSSRQLAGDFPDHRVVGVDRSAHRLQRGGWAAPGLVDGNLILLRADLVDCWRLLLEHGVRPDRHYLLYPNPYPKSAQLARRWHAHPVFPVALALGGRLELRTNWAVYAQEFKLALELAQSGPVQIQTLVPEQPVSPFEHKYALSGHQLFQVVADLREVPPARV